VTEGVKAKDVARAESIAVWFEIFCFADAGTKRPTTKNALPYIQGTGFQTRGGHTMRIQHVGIVALFISIAFAAPSITDFRSVNKPATRAPFSPQEIIAQAKLVQKCDPIPAKPIALVPSGAVSSRIKRLFDEDQQGRMVEKIDWDTLQRTDQMRRQEVIQYILRDQLSTDADFVGAGFIYQHGPCANSYLLAHQLAGYAIALSEGLLAKGEQAQTSRWLYAATWDRYLRNTGEPQRFGTQYMSQGTECKFELEPFDPAITDEERQQYNVPTLEESKARAVTFKCN
jgi:hypothetical protein